MSRMMTVGTTAALFLTAAAAGAQVTKVVPGETKTMTVTVEAIEQSTRSVTVKKPDGDYDVVYVPQTIQRFDTLKVGDTITARYYENLVVRLKPAGEPSRDTDAAGIVRGTQDRAAGTLSHQQTITATVVAIDEKMPSITFIGPRGWKYSSRVEDRKALAQVKVGDRVDLTWTEAMLLSLDDAGAGQSR